MPKALIKILLVYHREGMGLSIKRSIYSKLRQIYLENQLRPILLENKSLMDQPSMHFFCNLQFYLCMIYENYYESGWGVL